MNAAAPSLLGDVARSLVDEGWEVFEGLTQSALLVLVHGEDGMLPCRLELRHGGRRLTARVLFSQHLNESRLDVVEQYIAQANRALRDERFDLDPDDGALALEASVDLVDGDVARTQAHQLLVNVITAADHHFGAIMRIVYCPPDPFASLDMARWLGDE